MANDQLNEVRHGFPVLPVQMEHWACVRSSFEHRALGVEEDARDWPMVELHWTNSDNDTLEDGEARASVCFAKCLHPTAVRMPPTYEESSEDHA